MDGDIPDLPAFIAIARRNRAWLMVDEAHALGVLGPRGFGTADRFGADPTEIDIWMGTLSKSLVSCGGYIGGSKDLIDYLKLMAPGVVFSGGWVGSALGGRLAPRSCRLSPAARSEQGAWRRQCSSGASMCSQSSTRPCPNEPPGLDFLGPPPTPSNRSARQSLSYWRKAVRWPRSKAT